MEKYNIFEKIIVDKTEEFFFEIFKNETIKIEKIVSNGQTSPENFWYEQEKSEFILLLEGFAILEFENREVELKKGDCLNIEAMEKHRVKFTSLNEPTIWFAVFY
ncbi:MAG: cupin domain-containing protein [Aliarcobacter sp.]|jgi:cupin 2 domain-containing protein|nr:cupin domain-containing protein [Aliarcobacter sp.]MDX9901908.1 cupin domain-containing protein [Aliarcobacter sp.]